MDAWIAVGITLGILLTYETWLAIAQRLRPERLSRSAHATLREDWFTSLSNQKGTEILAVQTLRNSVMSATMTASTAVLGLMGSLSLTAPSLRVSFGETSAAWPDFTPRLAMELAVLALLLTSLVASIMAVRYYNHAGFIAGMPVDSDARKHWNPTGTGYVRKAGLLYSWGLRQLVLVVPLVAFILHPLAGVAGAILVTGALYFFDRVHGPG